MRLTSFRLVAYAPLFLAADIGAFEEEGLDVAIRQHTGHWSELIDAIADQDADVIVGNSCFANLPEKVHLEPFCQCVRQCGSVLVRSRGRVHSSFTWSSLRGRSIAVQSDVPTPWIAFRECLRLSRMNLDDLNVLVGLGNSDIDDALSAEALDFAILHAERIDVGEFEEAFFLADTLGPVPWSVFLSRVDGLSPDFQSSFRRAIGKALAWIDRHSAEEISQALARWFPDWSTAHLCSAVSRYLRMNAWPTRPERRELDERRWHEILLRWDFPQGGDDLAAKHSTGESGETQEADEQTERSRQPARKELSSTERTLVDWTRFKQLRMTAERVAELAPVVEGRSQDARRLWALEIGDVEMSLQPRGNRDARQ